MAFWDGAERTDKTWKALRLELAGALEVGAEGPVWQAALAACGEISPTVAIAGNITTASLLSTLAHARSIPEPSGAKDDPGYVESTVRYFVVVASLLGTSRHRCASYRRTSRRQSGMRSSLPTPVIWQTARQLLMRRRRKACICAAAGDPRRCGARRHRHSCNGAGNPV